MGDLRTPTAARRRLVGSTVGFGRREPPLGPGFDSHSHPRAFVVVEGRMAEATSEAVVATEKLSLGSGTKDDPDLESR